MKFEDLTGQRFTRLVVLTQEPSNKHGHTKWLCLCDCGRMVVAYASDLKRGGRPSCGCLKSEKLRESRKKPLGVGAANNMYAQYRKSASQRGIPFALSLEEFLGLIDKNCHYCGAGPTLLAYGEKRMKAKNVNGNFTYTGIDRKESKVGYVADNCITCCKTCNFAKNAMGYDSFIAYLDQLVQFRTKIGK